MTIIDREEAQLRILQAHGLCAPLATPLDAVQACIAVQTQYAMSLPVAIAARTKSHKPGWDARALAANGPIVKTWTLRRTLHAQTRADHSLILAVIGRVMYDRYSGLDHIHGAIDLKQLEEPILQALAEGPLSRSDLHDRVPELRTVPYAGWGMDVMGLAFKGRLCVIGRGAEQKFCSVDDSPVAGPAGTDGECFPNSDAALHELLRRYLRSYGPATLKDFSHWTGVPIGVWRHAVDALGEEVEAVEIEGLSGRRYALRAASTPQGNLPKVRLLAKFDPLILAHHDKRLFFGKEEHRKAVFRAAGQVEATVLAGGEVAATWRMKTSAKGLSIAVEPLRRLSKPQRAALDREADRLARALDTHLSDITGL